MIIQLDSNIIGPKNQISHISPLIQRTCELCGMMTKFTHVTFSFKQNNFLCITKFSLNLKVETIKKYGHPLWYRKMEGGGWQYRTKEKVCHKRNFNEIESVAFW